MKTTMLLVILCCSLVGAETTTVKDTTEIEVTVSPGEDCEKIIVKHITEAKTRVWVQMYNFTSVAISTAMIAAKKRGCDVQFLGDRSVRTEHNSQLNTLSEAHIACYLDAKHPIAHNKIILIDDNVVGTGSYNYSEHAKKNAENYVFISSKGLMTFYMANWETHRNHATPYEGDTNP